jgi:hypothetical protein
MSRGEYWAKKVESNPEKYPERAGFIWDDEETMNLLLAVRKNETFESIAKNHKRTERSIVCQLKRIAVDYYNDSMEMEKIIKYTRLSEDVINEAIEKDKYKNLSKEEKNKVKQEKNKDIGNIKPDIEILQKYERGIVSIVDKLTLMNTKNGAILETLQNIEGLLINISKKL